MESGKRVCIVTDARSTPGLVLLGIAVSGNRAIFTIDEHEYDAFKILDIINRHAPCTPVATTNP
jgi:hypothetical protein